MTNTIERTEQRAALGTAFGKESTQNGLEAAEQVYCPVHGTVKSAWGQCSECLDEGYLDFDATRVAKLLIPSWVGLDVTNRKVFVARVRDALDAVQKIGQYKNSDAIVLLIWGSVITPLENGKIGISWTLGEL